MPNQRSKNKTHFTAVTEKELKKAVEIYAERNGLDRNSAIREILWKSVQSEGIAVAPPEFFDEISEKKKSSKKKLKKT